MKARAQKSNWGVDIEVVLMNVSISPDGTDRDYVTDLILTHNPGPAQSIEPSFKMSYEDAQRFMDDLWECGLRPSEGTGSAGALAATQKHLEDMRKLVFKNAGL